MKFDLFGRELLVERRDERWLAYFTGPEGKRRPAEGIVIPAELGEAELTDYLDELCHEWASVKHPVVRRL